MAAEPFRCPVMCAVYLAKAQQVVLLPSRHINQKEETIIEIKLFLLFIIVLTLASVSGVVRVELGPDFCLDGTDYYPEAGSMTENHL